MCLTDRLGISGINKREVRLETIKPELPNIFSVTGNVLSGLAGTVYRDQHIHAYIAYDTVP
jgi:hypothetical protein